MRTLRVRIEDENHRSIGDHLLTKSPVRIGRNAMNDLALSSGYVSQWHCLVRFSDMTLEYMDLGSTNGTSINGKRVQPCTPVMISEQDTIKIGPLLLILNLSDERPPGMVTIDTSTVTTGKAKETIVDPEAALHYRQMRSITETIAAAYQTYRGSWKQVRATMEKALGTVTPTVRGQIAESLEKTCPDLRNEPEYSELMRTMGVTEAGAGSVAGAMSELQRVAGQKPGTPANAGITIKQAALTLEAFCSSFVELRCGLDQFSKDLAVRTFRSTTPIHTSKNGIEMLAYLLGDPGAENNKVGELKSAFADMMIHQVALISGVMEGVRGLLQRLSPAGVEEQLSKLPVHVGPFKVRDGMWPVSVLARWKAFVRMHQEFLEGDQEISAVLFGKEFARSYGAVAVSKARGVKSNNKIETGGSDPSFTPAREDTLPHKEQPPRGKSGREKT